MRRTAQPSEEFYELVDRFLELADTVNQSWPQSRVCHMLMYAAAHYSADWRLQGVRAPGDEDDARWAEDLSGQYREMLLHTVGELRERYREEGDLDEDDA